MRVSILGCGWLGMPLAKHLAGKDHEIKGSVTSEAKTKELMNAHVTPYVLFWDENGFNGDLTSFLETDILIITIPPSKVAAFGGLQKILSTILPSLEKAAVSKVIFMSSISVYGSSAGTISEENPVAPETPSAKDIAAAEMILSSAANVTATILRFGGLVGIDRHPVYSLSGKENIADPGAAINLINADDCIGIIEAIIEKGKWGHTINAVAPFHPSREAYYSNKASSLGLTLPKFSQETSSPGKIVLSPKVKDILDYTFTVTETI